MFEKNRIDNNYQNSIGITNEVAALKKKVVVSSLFGRGVFNGVLFSNGDFRTQKGKLFIFED